MSNPSVGPLLFLLLIGGPSFFGHCLPGGEDDKPGHGLITSREPRAAAEVMYPQGSSLPDCSHACGACFPCKRVMVGFKCLVAESCPIVYRCMCKGKYYHVPSS